MEHRLQEIKWVEATSESRCFWLQDSLILSPVTEAPKELLFMSIISTYIHPIENQNGEIKNVIRKHTYYK